MATPPTSLLSRIISLIILLLLHGGNSYALYVNGIEGYAVILELWWALYGTIALKVMFFGAVPALILLILWSLLRRKKKREVIMQGHGDGI